jgi:hypothetical protein
MAAGGIEVAGSSDCLPFNEHRPTEVEYLQDIRRSLGHFVQHPYRNLGDLNSVHNVLFGTLDPGYQGDVTVKPFIRRGKAQHEAEMTKQVGELGFPTLEVLDVASGFRFDYLITRYQPGLRNLGQLPWKSNIASSHLQRTLIPSLIVAASYAGELEKARIGHGDLQIKNVIIDEESTPVAVDLESTSVNIPKHEIPLAADRDMRRLGMSILKRGFLIDRSVAYRTQFLGRELVEPAYEVAGVSQDESVARRVAVEKEIEIGFLKNHYSDGRLRPRRRDAK